MAIDKTNLTTQVQARIDGLTGTETLQDLLILSKAAEGLSVNRTALDSAIETQLNGFDGASELKDLLVGNKAGVAPGVVPIGGLTRFPELFGPLIEKDNKKFLKSGFFTQDGFDSSLAPHALSAGIWESIEFSLVENGGSKNITSIGTDNQGNWVVGLQGFDTSDGLSVTAIISNDNADNWTALTANNGLSFQLSSSALSSNGVFLGSYSSGIYRSTDKGNTWNSVATLSSSIDCLVTDGNGVFMAGLSSGGIAVSSDNGLTWSEQSLFADELRDIATDEKGRWIAVGGLYNQRGEAAYSDDNGATWNTITLGEGSLTSDDIKGVTAIDTDGDGTWIMSSWWGYESKRSTDNGLTWESAPTVPTCWSLVTDRKGNWVSAGSYEKSEDNGLTWAPISTGISGSSNVWTASDRQGTWLISGQNAGLVRSVYGVGFYGGDGFDYMRIL